MKHLKKPGFALSEVLLASMAMVTLLGPGGKSGGASPGASASPAAAAAPNTAPSSSGAQQSTATGGLGGVIHSRYPTLYVLGLAPDVPTSVAIAIEVAMRLTPFVASDYKSLDSLYRNDAYENPYNREKVCWSSWRPYTGRVDNEASCRDEHPAPSPSGKSPLSPRLWIIAEPTWSVTDFVTQCTTDPQDTAGALILGAVENDTGSNNFIFWSEGYTRLYVDAFFVSCEERSSDEYEALGHPGHLTRVGPTSAKLTQVVTQTTTSAAGKSWAKAITILTSPDPNATPSIQAPKSAEPNAKATPTHQYTINWANAHPAVTTTTTTTKTFESVPQPSPTPAMTIVWKTRNTLVGGSSQGGVPLLTIAGIASYYASQSSSTSYTYGSCMGTGVGTTRVPCSKTTTNNSPSLPWQYGLLIFTGQQLSSVNVPQYNPSKVLKRAAANLATGLLHRLSGDCYDIPRPAEDNESIFNNPTDLAWICGALFRLPGKWYRTYTDALANCNGEAGWLDTRTGHYYSGQARGSSVTPLGGYVCYADAHVAAYDGAQ